jgi:hypothetical protein
VVIPELLEPLDLKEIVDLLEELVYLEIQEHLDQLDPLGKMELKENLEVLVQSQKLVNKEFKGHQDLMVFQEPREPPVPVEIKDLRDQKEPPDQKGKQVIEDQPVFEGLLVPKDLKVQ